MNNTSIYIDPTTEVSLDAHIGVGTGIRSQVDTPEHAYISYQTGVEHSAFKSDTPSEIEEYLEVPTTTLQEIIDSNNIEQIGCLKIDYEGSEGLILDSTPRSYLKRIRKIAIEFHHHLSKIIHHHMRKPLEDTGFTTDLKWDDKSAQGSLYAWRVDQFTQLGSGDREGTQ